MKNLIYVFVAVPLALIISISVLTSIAANSRSSFETTTTNETVKASGPSLNYTWIDLDNPVRTNTTTNLLVYNDSALYYNYTIDRGYQLSHSRIRVGTDGVGEVLITYPSYSGTGYDSYVEVYEQTMSGQRLGSMIPYVLIAVTIVGVVIGAFGLSRVMG